MASTYLIYDDITGAWSTRTTPWKKSPKCLA